MFFGILSVLLDGISIIFWKKSLNYKVGSSFFNLMAFFFPIFITTFSILYLENIFVGFNLKVFLLIIVFLLLGIVKRLTEQYAYKREKISYLVPYENANKIISIILGFFIFSDISKLSFFITLVAALLIIFKSFDFKKLKLNKTISIFFLGQITKSLILLLTGYILSMISEIDFFNTTTILFIIIFGISVIKNGEHKEIFNIPWGFYKYRITASFIGSFVKLLTLFIITQVGIVISVLLSFLYIGYVLILSYFMLGEKLSKKDIIFTIIITFLVGLGYYFK